MTNWIHLAIKKEELLKQILDKVTHIEDNNMMMKEDIGTLKGDVQYLEESNEKLYEKIEAVLMDIDMLDFRTKERIK